MARWMRLAFIVLALAVICAAPLLAQNPVEGATAEDGISLDFKDVELADLIRVVSEMTGRNFLFDSYNFV